MAERCTVQKPDRTGCGAYRMKDSDRCFLHRTEPEIKQQALVAQHKGGLAHVIRVGDVVHDLGWPKQIHLRKPRDVRRFVSRVMNEVRAGKVEPGLANSLFVGANVLLKTFDAEAVDKRENKPSFTDEEKCAILKLAAELRALPPHDQHRQLKTPEQADKAQEMLQGGIEAGGERPRTD